MKKIIGMTLTVLSLLFLCACGAPAAQPEETVTLPSATEVPATPTPTVQPEESPAPDARLAAAQQCIDRPVSVLYEAIGYPESSDYAPSCLEKGEDGNLYYDGFTVYTLRTETSETVVFVE